MTTIKINTGEAQAAPTQKHKRTGTKHIRCDRYASEQAKVEVETPSGGVLMLCRHHVNKFFSDRAKWEAEGYKFFDLVSEDFDKGRTGVGGLTDAD